MKADGSDGYKGMGGSGGWHGASGDNRGWKSGSADASDWHSGKGDQSNWYGGKSDGKDWHTRRSDSKDWYSGRSDGNDWYGGKRDGKDSKGKGKGKGKHGGKPKGKSGWHHSEAPTALVIAPPAPRYGAQSKATGGPPIAESVSTPGALAKSAASARSMPPTAPPKSNDEQESAMFPPIVSDDLLVDIEKCPEEWKLEDAQVFCSRYCCPKTLVPDGPGTYRATFDSKEAAVRACIAMSGAQVTTSTGEQVAIAAQHVGFEKRAPELQKAAEEQKTSEEQKAAADQQIAVGHKAGRWTGKSFKDALVRGPTSDPKQKAAAQAKPDVKHKAAAKKAAVPAAATKANQEGGAQSTAAPKAKVAIAAQHVGFEKRAPELQKAAEEQKASEEQKAAADQQIAVGHKAPYDAEDKSWAVVRKKANRKCTRPTPVRDQQMLWPKVSIQMEDGKVRTADYQLESRREEEQGCPESPAKAHNDVDKADHDGDWVVVRNNRKKAQHKTKTNKATSAG